jgi:hypothetical protein
MAAPEVEDCVADEPPDLESAAPPEAAGAPELAAGDDPAGAEDVPDVCAEANPTASRAVHENKYPVLICVP